MVFRVLALSLMLFTSFEGMSQNKIRWMSWEEVIKKMNTNPRKIFVDVYIEKCGWCKKMDKTSFGSDEVAKYINENYYPVKFDAESKQEIKVNGKTYKYINTSLTTGYHEFADVLLSGRMSFPSIVFIDEKFELIQAIPGYQNELSLEMITHFFGENHYKTTTWRRFSRNYEIERMGVPARGQN